MCKSYMVYPFYFIPIKASSFIVRIKSGEPCFPGFSVPGRLGGVICKPEGAA